MPKERASVMLTCCRLSPLLLEREGGVRFCFGIQVPNGVTLRSEWHHLLLQDWELPNDKDTFYVPRGLCPVFKNFHTLFVFDGWLLF